MKQEQSLEDQQQEISLEHAEAEFQLALDLIGHVREEFRAQWDRGETPETADIEFAIKNLNNAWRAAQTERTRVADFRRKNGELVPGDIDLDAARASICEQLDRIAASLKTS